MYSSCLELISAGDHVDILGRSSLNDLILRVAGGKGDQIEDNYVSNIREYSEKVRIYEEEDTIKSEMRDHLGSLFSRPRRGVHGHESVDID